MWFDAQTELAKLAGGRENDTRPPATLATPATPRARVAIVADVAMHPATTAQPITPNAASVATLTTPQINPKSETVGGRMTTWTGCVVSLDEWRRMTDWQRHGPNGRLWCGNEQAWID